MGFSQVSRFWGLWLVVTSFFFLVNFLLTVLILHFCVLFPQLWWNIKNVFEPHCIVKAPIQTCKFVSFITTIIRSWFPMGKNRKDPSPSMNRWDILCSDANSCSFCCCSDQNAPRGSVGFVLIWFVEIFIIYAFTLLSCQHVKCEVKFICSSSTICAHVNLSHKHRNHNKHTKIRAFNLAHTHLHTHLQTCTYAC